jgi:alginate O-acetyltransferase complex protein AlgI
MVFSSFIFLFLFFPFTILVNLLLDVKKSNVFLFLSSLLFYYYGERKLVFVLLFSILLNYSVGILIQKSKTQKQAKIIVASGIVLNLLILVFYKYLSYLMLFFSIDQSSFFISHLVLPIGISFFTFQGISYIVDVYKSELNYCSNLIALGLYISFFPQLIAGPIVKFHDLKDKLLERSVNIDDFFYGLERFIFGFIKKVVFANTIGLIADAVFESPLESISSPTAWVGIFAYSLQIYFDFSGYSDMAIGIGRIVGFKFKENFNYPYVANSLQNFWKRWHISLSTWFKEYVYIPLGGSRMGYGIMYRNLVVVFVLTGVWHGAHVNFLIWGCIHGFFILLEKSKCIKVSFPKSVQHLYVITILLISWVFFRVQSFENAILFLKKMFWISLNGTYYPFSLFSNYVMLVFIIGILLTTSFHRKVWKKVLNEIQFVNQRKTILKSAFLLCVFLYALTELATSSFNPFIYFRF